MNLPRVEIKYPDELENPRILQSSRQEINYLPQDRFVRCLPGLPFLRGFLRRTHLTLAEALITIMLLIINVRRCAVQRTRILQRDKGITRRKVQYHYDPLEGVSQINATNLKRWKEFENRTVNFTRHPQRRCYIPVALTVYFRAIFRTSNNIIALRDVPLSEFRRR